LSAPLAFPPGAGVAVTRAEPAGGPLGRRLAERGARVVAWTTMAIAPPADPEAFARAVAGLDDWDWVVFTSAHAVEAVAALAPAPPRARLAAVGRSTAAALAAAGWSAARVPKTFSGEALVAAFESAGDAAGARVLFPAGSLARDTVELGLAALGAHVARVEAYRTLTAPLDGALCRAQVESGEVVAATFASPSAVNGLAAALGATLFRELLARLAVASIGPVTSAALGAHGQLPDAEAAESTFDALADAAARALAARGLRLEVHTHPPIERRPARARRSSGDRA